MGFGSTATTPTKLHSPSNRPIPSTPKRTILMSDATRTCLDIQQEINSKLFDHLEEERNVVLECNDELTFLRKMQIGTEDQVIEPVGTEEGDY
jgi:hypothetical protein